jgi:hypothetical protein
VVACNSNCRPPTSNGKLESRVGSELKVLARKQAPAPERDNVLCPREEQPQEGNVLSSCFIENPVKQQQVPSTQVSHVHERSEGGGAVDRFWNSASNGARKLSLDSVVAEDLAGESVGVARGSEEPIVEATTKGLEDKRDVRGLVRDEASFSLFLTSLTSTVPRPSTFHVPLFNFIFRGPTKWQAAVRDRC